VSYYREGNPNPYDFESVNLGLESKELDRIYAEDFYNIIVKLRPDMKTVYILLIVIINLGLSATFLGVTAFNVFL
jgi:hypothetical protein